MGAVKRTSLLTRGALWLVALVALACRGPSLQVKHAVSAGLRVSAMVVYPVVFRWEAPGWRAVEVSQRLVDIALAEAGDTALFFGPTEVRVYRPEEEEDDVWVDSDAVARLARRCAVLMRRRGHEVALCQALRLGWRVRDQAGLSASARASNLDGALRLRHGAARDRALLRPIVIVDDVVTTGSSAAEAVRVLRTAGLDPVALATVAVTRRRRPGEPGAAVGAGGGLPLTGRSD